MVGSPQDIQCIVSTVSGVELSSVMISWMGPGGESITNDSRVTISPITSSGNNYTSSLQFTYLMEGDEGMYTCNVMILETNVSQYIDLNYLTGKKKHIIIRSSDFTMLYIKTHVFQIIEDSRTSILTNHCGVHGPTSVINLYYKLDKFSYIL